MYIFHVLYFLKAFFDKSVAVLLSQSNPFSNPPELLFLFIGTLHSYGQSTHLMLLHTLSFYFSITTPDQILGINFFLWYQYALLVLFASRIFFCILGSTVRCVFLCIPSVMLSVVPEPLLSMCCTNVTLQPQVTIEVWCHFVLLLSLWILYFTYPLHCCWEVTRRGPARHSPHTHRTDVPHTDWLAFQPAEKSQRDCQ